MSHLITNIITAPYLTCKSVKFMNKKGENFLFCIFNFCKPNEDKNRGFHKYFFSLPFM